MTDRLKKEIATLPVSAIAEPLNATLRSEQAAIVTAAPGAGKSTLLPLTMLATLPPDAGKIIVLEPRRVAARQIAHRIAWLLEETVGQTVGYRIRFENKVSAQTRIEVVTEGVLTRMLLDDPALEGTGIVVFDEFHERSLNTDEAFALVRQCQQLLREDLKMVVMSATIDAGGLAAALHCPVLHSEGRMFPVEVVHSKEEADAYNVALLVARTLLQAWRTHEGDLLAFLPGEAEIRRVEELLNESLYNDDNQQDIRQHTHIFPLYGLLSNEEQAQAIASSRPGERKVVLATPIAETSLTIEGVRVVVDSGLCRRMVFDPRNGLNHLETVRISLDMAAQRSGRAGRVAPGVCYRLWSTATESRMEAVRRPEILDADLTSLTLDAALWGERHVDRLPWLTPPPKAALLHAQQLLTVLGALDDEGVVTPTGKAIAKLPCHPRMARMLIADIGDKTNEATIRRKALATDLAALLEEKDPLADETDIAIDRRIDALRRARSSGKTGRWGRIAKVARQYADMVHADEDNGTVNPYDVGALLASAYPERIGKAWKEGNGVFQLAQGDLVGVEASDPMAAAEWIVAASMHRKPGGIGRVFLACIVDSSDLMRHASERDVVAWDAKSGAVVAQRETRVGKLLLDARPLPESSRDAVQRTVCEAIVKNGISMLAFTDEVHNLQRRLAFVSSRHPELELPPADTASICASAPEWGPLFLGRASTAAELKKIDLGKVIWSRMDYAQQQAVERLAPTHIVVPTGSRIRLEYRQGAEVPVLRVRLQECFGLVDTPLVDGTPVLMELLSPGFKPVQLTSDLRSFWETTYFEVRKELRRRYPKHAWPDNPLEAAPQRGTRKPIQ